jgi:zinc and cadmium transporter
MIAYILGASFMIMAASLSGALFASKVLGTWLAPRLRFLVALAAGVFSVIIFGLAEEALHEGLTAEVVGAFLFGGILLEVVTRFLPKGTHHHHGPHPEHRHAPVDARRMMLGDAVHNVHDGLTLVPAFLVSPVVGFGTAAGVLLHEVVQEISEYFVLREAGYSARKALSWNFAVSTTILIGITAALYLASTEVMGHLLIAFSAGGFTYILARDLLPSVIAHAKSEHRPLAYALAFAAGVAIMLTVSVAAPHEHRVEEYLLPDGMGLALY